MAHSFNKDGSLVLFIVFLVIFTLTVLLSWLGAVVAVFFVVVYFLVMYKQYMAAWVVFGIFILVFVILMALYYNQIIEATKCQCHIKV